LKTLDWISLDLDFDKRYKIFESQRTSDYQKWLKHLVDQRDAYKCFCKSHHKCLQECYNSKENMTSDMSNNDIVYIRFKNPNKLFTLFDYMTAEDKEYNSEAFGDFVLYKHYNNTYSESFKRTIDDNMYEVTHIIDNKKNINKEKNNILTNIYMFKPKKYIELPDVEIRHLDKLYTSYNLSYLKSRHFLPETVINEAYLLGFSKGPEKDYKTLEYQDRDKDLIINFKNLFYEVI
jgi:glutamyl/glutaminyl-tRNA synthetase